MLQGLLLVQIFNALLVRILGLFGIALAFGVRRTWRWRGMEANIEMRSYGLSETSEQGLEAGGLHGRIRFGIGLDARVEHLLDVELRQRRALYVLVGVYSLLELLAFSCCYVTGARIRVRLTAAADIGVAQVHLSAHQYNERVRQILVQLRHPLGLDVLHWVRPHHAVA